VSITLIKNRAQNRHHTVDLFRGIIIVMMILFHASFDLNHFHLISIDIKHDSFWRYARYVIVSGFIFIMAYTLVLRYGQKIEWKSVWRRFYILMGLALIITLATLALFPRTWIYFGVLHFMAFATLIGLIFINRPKFSLFLGLALWYAYAFDYIPVHEFFAWMKPQLGLPNQTEDLVFFIPWLAPMFIGIFAGYYKLLPRTKERQSLKWIYFLGRNSLMVYMVHQPILFSLVFLLSEIG